MPWASKLLSFLIFFGTVGLQAQQAADPDNPPTKPEAPGVQKPEKSEQIEKPKADEPMDIEDWERTDRHRGNRDPVIFGSDFLLRPNETIRELVVIGGNADIQGHIRGELVVIGGKAKISGRVDREAVVVLGGAEISDSARLGGETVLIGGPFDISDNAYFAHDKKLFALGNLIPEIEWIKSWFVHGLMYGRLLTFGTYQPWIVALFWLLLYLIVLVVFPSAIKSTVRALEGKPVASICSGLLAMVLSAPLTVLLVITIVGILVVPFVKLAMLLAIIFGKAALICFLGRNLSRSAGGAGIDNLLFSFLVGAVLLTLAYTIPVFGLLAYSVAGVFGLGGALVALGGTFKREEGPASTLVAVPLGPNVQPAVSPAPSAVTLAPADSSTPPVMASITNPATIGPSETILLPRAGFWKRFLALLLDLVLIGMLIPLVKAWAIFFGIAYFVTMWTWKGTTIGSIVVGLKVVRTDGTPVSFPVALVRSLSSVFSAVVLFLGFLWAGWDREKQAWHDKIAGTVVVRMPRGFALI